MYTRSEPARGLTAAEVAERVAHAQRHHHAVVTLGLANAVYRRHGGDHDDIAPFDARIEVLGQPDFTGGRCAGAVAGTGHEIDADLAVGAANQIAEKHECALEDADEMKLPAGQVLADLLCEGADPRGEFVFANQDGRCRRGFRCHGGKTSMILVGRRQGRRRTRGGT